ncbi:Uncharacterised protein [Mycobacteroides abscessus subsp. abscessus]|nr:Uncharacterised protein [Mycobacteroides abscessus subsp. abscessus]
MGRRNPEDGPHSTIITTTALELEAGANRS